MVTAIAKPFDLLMDDDNVDPPAQAVRESKADGSRGGGHFGGQGYIWDSPVIEDVYGSDKYNDVSGGYKRPSEEGDKNHMRDVDMGPHVGVSVVAPAEVVTGGDAADGERHQKVYVRHRGLQTVYVRHREIAYGSAFKHYGCGDWEIDYDLSALVLGELVIEDDEEENPEEEPEEQEPEEKKMTLEEYEIVLEEKRKPLLALKAEERKVVLDKDLETLQVLSSKKSKEEIFVKLGTDKDKRIKFDYKEEITKKSVHLPDCFKPAVPGGKYYNPCFLKRHGRGALRGGTAYYGGRYKVP